MEKAVSVVVPCYCIKDEYFDGLMKSLLNQTLGKERLEIVLVDDGSPDDTYAKLQEYEQRAPETIMVIHCSENGGPGSARTIGLSYATGEYVAFADQDDWVDLAMYQLMYEKGKEYDCDIVKCGWCREEKTYESITSDLQKQGQIFEIHSKEDRKKLFDTMDLGGYWAALYQRTMLLENEIFFPAGLFYDDNFFAGLVHFYGRKYYFCREKMYHWYINTKSVSMGNILTRHTDRLSVELLLVDETIRRGFFEEYHDYVELSFFERYFLNTFITLTTRQGSMPLSLWQMMREQLFSKFPGCTENSLVRKRHQELYQKEWIETIIRGVMQLAPELWENTCWQQEYEDLRKDSFIELILRNELTQAQWELIQFSYLMLRRLRGKNS